MRVTSSRRISISQSTSPLLPVVAQTYVLSCKKDGDRSSPESVGYEVNSNKQRLETILDESEPALDFEADYLLVDDVLMEGIKDEFDSADCSCLSNDEVQPTNTANEFGREENDNHFLLMQEPIVEDPRQEYSDMLWLVEAHNLKSISPLRQKMQRSAFWMASRRVSLEHSTPKRPASVGEIQINLEHLAASLRQSEITRRLIQEQLGRGTWQIFYGNDWSQCFPGMTSFSVDESRQSLLRIIEEQSRRTITDHSAGI